MKNYWWTRAESSRKYSRNKTLITLVVVGAVLVGAFFLVPRFLSLGASVVLSPVVYVDNWLDNSAALLPSYFRSRNALIANEKELRQELSEAKSEVESIEALRQENNMLKGVVGKNEDREVASVIARPTELPYDVLIIDKGRDYAVKPGAPVYVDEDRVIGFVAEVHPNTSVVALSTTPGFESTVYVYGPNIFTTAYGVGGGNMEIQVPQGIEIAAGNSVVLPAFDAGIYGTISVVDSSPTRPEQYGYVSTGIPLQSIRFVTIGEAPIDTMSFEEARVVVDKVRREFLTVPVPEGVLVEIPNDHSTTSATSTLSNPEL